MQKLYRHMGYRMSTREGLEREGAEWFNGFVRQRLCNSNAPKQLAWMWEKTLPCTLGHALNQYACCPQTLPPLWPPSLSPSSSPRRMSCGHGCPRAGIFHIPDKGSHNTAFLSWMSRRRRHTSRSACCTGTGRGKFLLQQSKATTVTSEVASAS